jgi:hypothetical protein
MLLLLFQVVNNNDSNNRDPGGGGGRMASTASSSRFAQAAVRPVRLRPPKIIVVCVSDRRPWKSNEGKTKNQDGCIPSAM